MDGWWHPYFYFDISDVQFLFKWLPITGFFPFVFVAVLLFLLCLFDRIAAVKGKGYVYRKDAQTPRRGGEVGEGGGGERRGSQLDMIIAEDNAGEQDTTMMLWWACSRLSSGLVMSVMMTFNVILFFETILFLTGAQYLVVKRGVGTT